MKSPKVSIIIPCYNAEKWIEKCVNSALNQTYENIEVIVVDNESSDNSLVILNEKFGKNDKVMIETAENIVGMKQGKKDFLFQRVNIFSLLPLMICMVRGL